MMIDGTDETAPLLNEIGDEQAALRRVATLVARGAPPEEAFAAITEEAGRALAVDGAVLEQYAADGTDVFVGVWSRSDVPLVALGSCAALGGENVSSLVFRTGQPGRVDDYARATGCRRCGALRISVPEFRLHAEGRHGSRTACRGWT